MASDTMAGALWRNKPGIADITVETILLALCFVSLGLRLWSRYLQRASLQINDWLMLAAVPPLTARYGVEMAMVIKCGMGLHATEVKATAGEGILTLLQKFIFIIDLLWVTIVTLVKLSILHFYLKVFRSQTFTRLVYVGMVLCASFWLGTFWATVFFCDPPSRQWNDEIGKSCGNPFALYSASALTDLALNVFVIGLPMPILWNLQLPRSKKIALTFVFGLGFIVIGFTASRIKLMLELDREDVTYSGADVALLSAIVPLLGFITANLPLMAPASKKIFDNLTIASVFKSSEETGNSSYRFKKLAEPEVPLVNIQKPAETAPVGSDQIRITTDWEVRTTEAKSSPWRPDWD